MQPGPPDPWTAGGVRRIRGQVKRLVFTPTRLTWAVLVTGVATWGIVWAVTYKPLVPKGQQLSQILGLSPRGSPPPFYVSPSWAIPLAAVIAIAAVGADFLILRRR